MPPTFEMTDDMLQQLLPEAIQIAARTFPADTGLGHGNISPRGFLRLSDPAIETLAKLFMPFERRGTWTEILDLVLIVLFRIDLLCHHRVEISQVLLPGRMSC